MTDSNTELIQNKDVKYKIQNLSFKRKLDGNILSHVFLEKSEFCVVAHGVRVSNREQVALISNAFVSPGTKQVSTDNLAMSISFILHDELLRLQEDSGPNYFIPHEVAIQGRSDGELNRYLNGSFSTEYLPLLFDNWQPALDITDRVEVSSDSISDPLVFDKIRSFLKWERRKDMHWSISTWPGVSRNFASVKPRISAKLFDIILSGNNQPFHIFSIGEPNVSSYQLSEPRLKQQLKTWIIMKRKPWRVTSCIWNYTASLYIGFYQPRKKRHHQHKALDPKRVDIGATMTILDTIGVPRNLNALIW